MFVYIAYLIFKLYKSYNSRMKFCRIFIIILSKAEKKAGKNIIYKNLKYNVDSYILSIRTLNKLQSMLNLYLTYIS